MDKFLEIFYGTIVEPVKTFRNIEIEKNYKMPLFVVFLIAFFLLVLNQDIAGLSIFSNYLSNIVNLIIYWLFLAFFIDLTAKIFTQQSSYSKLLTLLALAFIPFVFIAPLKLLKNSFGIFVNIADLLLILTWIWTIILQVLAISETYKIPRKNAILFLIIPFLGSIVYFIWFFDFLAKIVQFSSL